MWKHSAQSIGLLYFCRRKYLILKARIEGFTATLDQMLQWLARSESVCVKILKLLPLPGLLPSPLNLALRAHQESTSKLLLSLCLEVYFWRSSTSTCTKITFAGFYCGDVKTVIYSLVVYSKAGYLHFILL